MFFCDILHCNSFRGYNQNLREESTLTWQWPNLLSFLIALYGESLTLTVIIVCASFDKPNIMLF